MSKCKCNSTNVTRLLQNCIQRGVECHKGLSPRREPRLLHSELSSADIAFMKSSFSITPLLTKGNGHRNGSGHVDTSGTPQKFCLMIIGRLWGSPCDLAGAELLRNYSVAYLRKIEFGKYYDFQI